MAEIVIAGFGSAGYAAMSAIRRADASAGITVIDPKQTDLFHPCGLPYALEGRADQTRLQQDVALDRAGVQRIKARAVRINGGAHQVICDTGQLVRYDQLIIAQGSDPVVPPIPGIDEVYGAGLYTLASAGDLERLLPQVVEGQQAIVVGAGAIGLETAVALATRGMQVTVFEMREEVLPGALDTDIAVAVREHISALGILVKTGSGVDEILHEQGRFCGVRSAGTEFRAQLGIMAAGFRPRVRMAQESGIECGRLGIGVDRRMRTSMDDVYAAGDCAALRSRITGDEIPVKLATSAYKTGLIAGANVVGGNLNYAGSAATFVTDIAGLEIAATGFAQGACTREGLNAVVGKLKSRILPDYMGGEDMLQIKVLLDPANGRFLGAQATGAGAASRVNLVSMAIEFDIPAEDFMRTELAYCPAVSEVHDPLFKAVEFAMRRIRR